MAFRWQEGERVEFGLRRIATEQIDRALSELSDLNRSDASKVHQARRRCKNLRSLLRLTKPGLGKAFCRENAWFRETARELASARDEQAAQNATRDLVKHFPDRSDAQLLATFGAAVNLAVAEGSIAPISLPNTESRFRQAGERIAHWRISKGGFRVLRSGLENTYRRGALAMGKAYAAPSPATFHEWRKFVNYHWRHCRLLQAAWPSLLEARYREARRLSDLLGTDHDLAILRSFVSQPACAAFAATEVRSLFTFIDQRRSELELLCRPLGARLFAESPHAFGKRVAAYWNA